MPITSTVVNKTIMSNEHPSNWWFWKWVFGKEYALGFQLNYFYHLYSASTGDFWKIKSVITIFKLRIVLLKIMWWVNGFNMHLSYWLMAIKNIS